MKLTARDRKVLIIGAVVIAAFVLIRFALVPLYRYSAKMSDEIKNVKFQYKNSDAGRLLAAIASQDTEQEDTEDRGTGWFCRGSCGAQRCGLAV